LRVDSRRCTPFALRRRSSLCSYTNPPSPCSFPPDSATPRIPFAVVDRGAFSDNISPDDVTCQVQATAHSRGAALAGIACPRCHHSNSSLHRRSSQLPCRAHRAPIAYRQRFYPCPQVYVSSLPAPSDPTCTIFSSLGPHARTDTPCSPTPLGFSAHAAVPPYPCIMQLLDWAALPSGARSSHRRVLVAMLLARDYTERW